MIGSKHGRWLILAEAERDKNGQRQYLCRCDCGTERVVRKFPLLYGKTLSCGCLVVEVVSSVNVRRTRHGHAKDNRVTKEYRAWAGMKSRCYDPKLSDYGIYGGRGITVCERWRDSFEHFLQDVGMCPGVGREWSIDRIDSNGHYEPGNVRWATAKEQSNNTRANRLLTVDGITANVVQWSEMTGINRGTIQHRLNRGWSESDAVKTPPMKRGRGSEKYE